MFLIGLALPVVHIKQQTSGRNCRYGKGWTVTETIECHPSTTGNTETRFVSRHGITERVMIHKKVYMDLDKDVDFLSWFHKETNPIRKEVHTPVYTTSKNFGVLDNLSNF